MPGFGAPEMELADFEAQFAGSVVVAVSYMTVGVWVCSAGRFMTSGSSAIPTSCDIFNAF